MKTCTECLDLKPFEDFYRDGYGQFRAVCKACVQQRAEDRKQIGDEWAERACEHCGELFKPRSGSRFDAARVKYCSSKCIGQGVAASLGTPGSGRTAGSSMRKLRPEELEVCTRCSLRGHQAGHPEKCLGPVWTFGHADGGSQFLGRKR